MLIRFFLIIYSQISTSASVNIKSAVDKAVKANSVRIFMEEFKLVINE